MISTYKRALEVKSGQKILTEDEKQLFYNKAGYDFESAGKLMASILLNSFLFFKDDKRVREEFIKSFEWCNKKIN